MMHNAMPLLWHLQRHFKLRCTVKTWTRLRSRAYVRSRRIFINPDSPMGAAVALHEFAHLLAERRVPGQGHWHKVAFREALCDVIQAVGWTLTEYPWHREYLHLYRWAVKHGHATCPWWGDPMPIDERPKHTGDTDERLECPTRESLPAAPVASPTPACAPALGQ